MIGLNDQVNDQASNQANIKSLQNLRSIETNCWSHKTAADHVQEWLDSGVDPGIIALNVETLIDTAVNGYAESLFPIAERLNWNITRFGQKTRSHLRGWWVSGVDPFNAWQRMAWGRFKPDAATPVLDRTKGKPAKYLSPRLGAGSSRLVLLDVPQSIWDKVAQRYNTLITPADRPCGFWCWVWKWNIPVIVTEGEKKAGCLLTQGYAAIALPGIFSGYRKETQQLIPELAYFATVDRSIYICFDYETKPKIIKNINLAITKLGTLLDAAGCSVQVITLPGSQKGVDDFIVAHGQQSFEDLYKVALPLQFWLASRLWALTYPAAIALNTPYVSDLPYPDSGLACIKSAKGTGKTTALQPLIQKAASTGRKVLVISHRIQLGRAICKDIGIDWIEEIKGLEIQNLQNLSGYGLCIDSLHPTSQARFNPQSWKGAIVILDEVEQVLWHVLNSSTCYQHRIKILETLRELVQVVLSSGGLIIAQDADLSDVSIDYLKGLVDESIDPWIVVNDWKPETGWAVSFYDTKNPAPLLSQVSEFIQKGAVYIAVDSQKVSGKWSSKNLETYLQSCYPHKRILRIDSESVADPLHPAYEILKRLNQVISTYDIVLATPTIGTGISIDIKGHFQAVFGIFQGVTSDTESRQALARVREPVPRLVWAARFGPRKVGNGSCSYQDVIHSTTKAVKYNIALLKEVDFDIDVQTDPITLRSWAKMAARVNLSLWSYRNEFHNGLVMEGHKVTTISDDSLNLPPDIRSLDAEQFDTEQPDIEQLDSKQLNSQQTEKSKTQSIEQIIQEDPQGNVLKLSGGEPLQEQNDEAIAKQTIAEILAQIKAIQQQSRLREAQAISRAADLTFTEYNRLKDQRSKTIDERYAQTKHELQRRYPIPVTPELKIKDDEGWYAQLRLHYYLSHDLSFVQLRDLKELQEHLDHGNGKVALQDVKLLTAQVETLRVLGILNFLDSDRRVRATDTDVQQLYERANQYRHDIKTILNLTISNKMKPIEVIQALLGKLGLKLTCVGRDVAQDGRRGGLRVYQYRQPEDGRDIIFAQWQQQETIAQATETTETKEASQHAATSALISMIPIADPDPPSDIDQFNRSKAGSNQLQGKTQKQSSLNSYRHRINVDVALDSLLPDSLASHQHHEVLAIKLLTLIR